MTFNATKYASSLLSYRLYPYDLYTRDYVRFHKRTIDNVIPVPLLEAQNVYLGNDAWKNMFVVHSNIHKFRSGYRFGGSVDDILNDPTEWETMRHVVFRNRHRKLFFPLYGQHTIVHTWTAMCRKYPILENIKDEVAHMDDLDTWSRKPSEQFDKDFMELRERSMTHREEGT